MFPARQLIEYRMCGMFLRRPRDCHSPRARRDRISPKTARNLIHHRDLSPARHVRADLQPAVAAAKVRLVSDRKKISAHAHRAASVPRRGFAVTVKATADDKNGPSRRDILSAPGLAALLSAAVPAEQLWLPGMASAKRRHQAHERHRIGDSIAAAKLGPIGGAVPCSDYKA